ncbi:MAG: PilW family protein [Deltaproteobacteria bacterium]|nr:PilW family protein [Deltaproteobacteria bacterium]
MSLRRSTKNSGFTLVELLVALAMGLIVLSVIFTMFRTSTHSSVLQDSLSEMQQNLRVAMHTVARDIRTAGCGLNLVPSTVATLQVYNGGWNTILPITGTNSSTGPDSITLFYGNVNTGEYVASLTAAVPDASAGLVVDGVAGFDPAKNNTVVVSNGITASLFVVTQVAGLTLLHDPTLSNYNAPAASKAFPSGTGYNIGARVYNFVSSRYVTYSIDSATDPAHPALVANLHDGSGNQIIADNIEDMQCYYILSSGAQTNNPVGQEAQIRAVRISFVARTAEQDRDAMIFQRITVEDHIQAVGAADGYRRRLLSTTIKLRNMG